MTREVAVILVYGPRTSQIARLPRSPHHPLENGLEHSFLRAPQCHFPSKLMSRNGSRGYVSPRKSLGVELTTLHRGLDAPPLPRKYGVHFLFFFSRRWTRGFREKGCS